MQQSEVVTATGFGVWGDARYELQLLTSSKTYCDSSGQATRTVTRFVLAFGIESQVDRRWFRSERSRRTFIEQSFSNLALTDIPKSEQDTRQVKDPLQAAVGEYLSSVTFVMDYLQIDFCGHRFNMYNWPTVIIGAQTLTLTSNGYRDAICSLIGETLTGIEEYLDRGLTLQFKSGCSIGLSLRVGKDFPSPEVAEYWSPSQKPLIIWQAGEEPFD